MPLPSQRDGTWIPPNRVGRVIAGHLLRSANEKAIELSGGDRELMVRCLTGYGGLSLATRVKLGQFWMKYGAHVPAHRNVDQDLRGRLSA